jgi:hypothetical protein
MAKINKVELIKADDMYAVRITTGAFWWKEEYYADFKDLGYSWKIDTKQFKDCWTNYDAANQIYIKYKACLNGDL